MHIVDLAMHFDIYKTRGLYNWVGRYCHCVVRSSSTSKNTEIYDETWLVSNYGLLFLNIKQQPFNKALSLHLFTLQLKTNVKAM